MLPWRRPPACPHSTTHTTAPPPQVLSFAGELLSNAEPLLRDGLHPTEIADGYAKAGAKALEILDTLAVPGTGACAPAAVAARHAFSSNARTGRC